MSGAIYIIIHNTIDFIKYKCYQQADTIIDFECDCQKLLPHILFASLLDVQTAEQRISATYGFFVVPSVYCSLNNVSF